MNILQAVLLGVVEGITEFLPISSTGHMVLVSHWAGILQTEFVKSFEIIIQLGAISAIGVLYAKRFFVDLAVAKRILAVFIPTGVVGFLLYSMVKTYLIGNVWVTVIALLVGGVAMIVVEKVLERKQRLTKESPVVLAELSYGKCVVIGLAQAVAVVPGVSRSAATILTGMVVGLSRIDATEFSFLVATPTLLAASGLDLVASGFAFSSSEWVLLGVGFVTAFFAAWLAVTWMMRYLRSHSLVGFGVYRIVLAGVVLFSSL